MTDIDAAVDELERIVHPEGRCEVCGGGKPYWKHIDPNADGYHAFIGPRGHEPVQRVHGYTCGTCDWGRDGNQDRTYWDYLDHRVETGHDMPEEGK